MVCPEIGTFVRNSGRYVTHTKTIPMITSALPTYRFLVSLCLLMAGIASPAVAQDKTGPKKRIAVFSFDDKSDSNFGWYGTKSVGDGISDMVITELVKSGKYRVIERTEIDALLSEQSLGASGIVTAESAAEIGKMLGVEVAVFGAVTEFGYKKDDTNVRVQGIGLGLGKQSAVAGVDIRMVNTSTGEILVAENVRRSKTGMAPKIRTSKFTFDNRQAFDQSLVGKVTREAVNDVVSMVTKNANQVPWSAKVVTTQGGKVYINSGSLDGIKVGDVFKVFREGTALVDPDTGLELGSVEEAIGLLKVTDNSVGDGKASVCTVVQGSGFERGDVVREQDL